MSTFKMVEVKEDEIEALRSTGHSSFSKPVFEEFMASNFFTVELTLDKEMKPQSAVVALKSYLIQHPDIPVKPFMRGGKLYLQRLDRTRSGTEIPNWREINGREEEGE